MGVVLGPGLCLYFKALRMLAIVFGVFTVTCVRARGTRCTRVCEQKHRALGDRDGAGDGRVVRPSAPRPAAPRAPRAPLH